MKTDCRNSLLHAICIFFCCMISLSGCTTEEIVSERDAPASYTTYKVACILPLSSEQGAQYQQTVEWALNNLFKAQRGLAHGVKLETVWYDENTVDMVELGKKIENDASICATIGPILSRNVRAIGESVLQCTKRPKPIVTPQASSSEIVRMFSYNANVISQHNANGGFLWALSEADITQCEILLSKALMYGAKRVSLLAKENDLYGQTFIDWFGFQAKELGLTVKSILTYQESNVQQVMSQSLTDLHSNDYLICIPSHEDDLYNMLQFRASHLQEMPKLLFSDVAFTKNILSDSRFKGLTAGISGISMSSDPESGFTIFYYNKFHEQPTAGISQLYDSVTLLAFALFNQKEQEDLNQTLRRIVDGREKRPVSWQAEGLGEVFSSLQAGIYPDLAGASGCLDFDRKVYTNVLHSSYCEWIIVNNAFEIIDYISSSGSRRTDATLAAWNWKNSHQQDFDPNASFTYPPVNDQWALLIAGSTGWGNYRHQADVLAVYQLLKRNGYTDDHIILIMEDDIAYNSNNMYKGEIRVRPGGENLYQNLQIDYKLSTISPSALLPILRGESSAAYPQTIQSSPNDNLFVFWSGHGTTNVLGWGEKSMMAKENQKIFATLAAEKRFRKILFTLEACYGGSIGKACEGIDGLLFMTAANEYEPSKADVVNLDMGVYMSNSFSRTLIEQTTQKPAISLRDLYYILFQNTTGSHVSIYNDNHFDNLFKCTMKEFLVYQSK